MTTTLTLYGTSACHLCEKAKELLWATSTAASTVSFEQVDIAIDDDLLERYGVRIPVLREQSSGRELAWPFNLVDLRLWLSEVEGL